MRHPFLRTLAGSAATPTDPNFENVTLLLHGDGTNGGQNNTFVDGSANNFAITRNGNTTQGTFSPYGDNWSNYFDTSNTSLVATGTTSSGNFPTSTDFTIEFWWCSKLVNSGTGIVVAKTQFASISADSWWMEVNGSYKVAFVGHSGASTFTPVTSTTSVMDGVWHHCAISRAGTTYRVFVDGALEQTTTNSTTMNQGSRNITFAGITTNTGQNYGATGYISNLRIVVGTCLYTAAFTPSITPLTSVTNTVLLTCQSNRFKDNGPNAYTISTQQGTPSVQRFSPFSPNAAYAAGTIGGSGYFDGTGDYLLTTSAAALAIGTSAFTLQGWCYFNNTNTNGAGFGNCAVFTNDPSTARGVSLFLTGSGAWRFRVGRSVVGELEDFLGTTTLVAGQWYHFAIVRTSTGTNDTRIYLNGVQEAIGTSTISLNMEKFSIGTYTPSDITGQALLNGYVCDVRFTNTAESSTVPTSPLTAVTGTKYLCNFQNAAIRDNAMMAVPETVGNAQIDTTTKKYGTGSLKFDGTGDYLKFPASKTLEMGTGDFTVEFWIYIAARTSFAAIFLSGLGANDLYVNFDTSGNVLRLTNSTTAFAVTGTIPLTTWTHIAVVRSSGSSKIYVDGTGGTAVTCTINFTATGPSIGAANAGQSPFNGYIDDLRITKGVARYTSNFTPPTAAFPDL